jgi:hypothetical protein
MTSPNSEQNQGSAIPGASGYSRHTDAPAHHNGNLNGDLNSHLDNHEDANPLSGLIGTLEDLRVVKVQHRHQPTTDIPATPAPELNADALEPIPTKERDRQPLPPEPVPTRKQHKSHPYTKLVEQLRSNPTQANQSNQNSHQTNQVDQSNLANPFQAEAENLDQQDFEHGNPDHSDLPEIVYQPDYVAEIDTDEFAPGTSPDDELGSDLISELDQVIEGETKSRFNPELSNDRHYDPFPEIPGATTTKEGGLRDWLAEAAAIAEAAQTTSPDPATNKPGKRTKDTNHANRRQTQPDLPDLPEPTNSANIQSNNKINHNINPTQPNKSDKPDDLTIAPPNRQPERSDRHHQQDHHHGNSHSQHPTANLDRATDRSTRASQPETAPANAKLTEIVDRLPENSIPAQVLRSVQHLRNEDGEPIGLLRDLLGSAAEDEVSQIEQKLNLITHKVEQLDYQINTPPDTSEIDNQFANIGGQLAEIDGQFANLESQLESRLATLQNTIQNHPKIVELDTNLVELQTTVADRSELEELDRRVESIQAELEQIAEIKLLKQQLENLRENVYQREDIDMVMQKLLDVLRQHGNYPKRLELLRRRLLYLEQRINEPQELIELLLPILK